MDSSLAKPAQGAGLDAGCLSQDLIQLCWWILTLYLAGQPLAVLPHRSWWVKILAGSSSCMIGRLFSWSELAPWLPHWSGTSDLNKDPAKI